MRSVPEWSTQLAWWASGIFATGAAWYFLSTKNIPYTVGSVVFALIFAGIAIALHIKKDAFAEALIPIELKSDLPADYVRRSTENEAHVRLVRHLPDMKAVAYQSSLQGWDTGVTFDMKEANYDLVDFLEFAWLRLAEFYPRNHFQTSSLRGYIEARIRTSFTFHWAKNEPAGPGSGGTIAGVSTGLAVIDELDDLIVDLAQTLFFDNQFLNFED